METTPAAKLKILKPISKTKIKKTIKNVVCRPDPVKWLLASDEEKLKLETVLHRHHVDIPIFKKPHWNEIKSIPKEKRPKPPQIKKVDGLLFGMMECRNALQSGVCSGIIIESDINPKLLAESIIEDCISNSVPYICLKGLRKTCSTNFGIPTSCLGIKKDYLDDIASLIQNIYRDKQPIKKDLEHNVKPIGNPEQMDIDSNIKPVKKYPYLYRNNKKSRVFSPSNNTISEKDTNKFVGQSFIELPKTQELDRKSYMNMILKKISSNPNRVKLKEK